MRDTTVQHATGAILGWALAGWAGVVVVAYACLGPIWSNWTTRVVAPEGGAGPLHQAGLLEWSLRNWQDMPTWLNLPIFHPLRGGIGLGDSLLGQAWLITPFRLFPIAGAAAQYNLAMLISLLLTAIAMGVLWRAAGGNARSAGIAGLLLIGAPYTISRLGYLNQLPPPLVIFAFASLVFMLQRYKAGVSTRLPLFLLSGAIVLQATWGWQGLAFAVVGLPVFGVYWLVCDIRQRRIKRAQSWREALAAKLPRLLRILIVPMILVSILVYQFAAPQRSLRTRLGDREPAARTLLSQDTGIGDFFDEGDHRRLHFGSPADEPDAGLDKPIINPGWPCIALAILGLAGRRRLGLLQRRTGYALLFTGGFSLIPSLVSTPWHTPGPAWSFVWLLTVAVVWWAAAGFDALLDWSGGRFSRQLLPCLLILAMIFLSLPIDLPAVDVPLDGLHREALFPRPGAVLALPAPMGDIDQDPQAAIWFLRALQTGQPYTGGGGVRPPRETLNLVLDLRSCEAGTEDPQRVFDRLRASGIVSAEIALESGDAGSREFWRRALLDYGAHRSDPWPVIGYEMYSLPENDDQTTPRSSKKPE